MAVDLKRVTPADYSLKRCEELLRECPDGLLRLDLIARGMKVRIPSERRRGIARVTVAAAEAAERA